MIQKIRSKVLISVVVPQVGSFLCSDTRLLSCPFPSLCLSSAGKPFFLFPGGPRSMISHPVLPAIPFLWIYFILLLLNTACSFRPSEYISLLVTAFSSSLHLLTCMFGILVANSFSMYNISRLSSLVYDRRNSAY